MNYTEFVSRPKSMVIAPAGYGKTHAIAECLKHTEGKQLILTHTHAGVASLKEKIQKMGIVSNQYRVETITSFAQKYVDAFYCGNDVPEQYDSEAYYPFIIENAKKLFEIQVVRDVIKATYSGLFVDEYQDCTIRQHDLIQVLASILPTRVLGDHLQGIFYFKGEVLVDFDNHLNDFEKFPDLAEPWRWKKENPDLGDCLIKIRELLKNKNNVDLNLYHPHIEILHADENDKYTPDTDYNRKIWSLTREDNLLIVHPDSTNLNVRKDFISRFKNEFLLIEAIDDKAFYEFSRKFDDIDSNNAYEIIYDLIPDLFNGSTSRDAWFNKNGVKRKTSESDRDVIKPICEDIEKIKQYPSLSVISEMLRKIRNLPNMKCYRRELFSDLCKALEQAEYKSISVHEAMKEIRNIKRRTGRKINGKCIGTTLLTKGLEFDTVAILDAHKFSCCKNFYVAITRARKRLIIFTKDKILSPYRS
ncbi:MAG: AAA family ATPase [Nitrospiraceae bacterium]|nr:AAA family ATPase [Nitrospiraceae bacterium]